MYDYDTETIVQVFEDIRSHLSPLTERQEAYVDTCEAEFDGAGAISERKIARLYEILDELDERAGYGRSASSEDEWWEGRGETFDSDGALAGDEYEGWDEEQFWS